MAAKGLKQREIVDRKLVEKLNEVFGETGQTLLTNKMFEDIQQNLRENFNINKNCECFKSKNRITDEIKKVIQWHIFNKISS